MRPTEKLLRFAASQAVDETKPGCKTNCYGWLLVWCSLRIWRRQCRTAGTGRCQLTCQDPRKPRTSPLEQIAQLEQQRAKFLPRKPRLKAVNL